MTSFGPSTLVDGLDPPEDRSIWRAGLWAFLALQAEHYLEACPAADVEDLVSLREAIWLMNCRAQVHRRAVVRRSARHLEARAAGRHLVAVREPSRSDSR